MMKQLTLNGIEPVARPRQQPASVHFSSESPEWYTPVAILDRVVDVMGTIDLDPSSNSHAEPAVPATTHYTKDDDGLGKSWSGRVYLNPPYGRELSAWVRKLVREHTCGNVTEAIALLPSRTDTKWFRRLSPFPKCFLQGRLRFSGSKQSAPFPSMLVYLGKQPEKFAEVFADVGDTYAITRSAVWGQDEKDHLTFSSEDRSIPNETPVAGWPPPPANHN